MAAGLHRGYFMRHHLALFALIALGTASLADAAPRRRAKSVKKQKKIAPPPEQPDDESIIEMEDESERVALSIDDEDEDDVEDEEVEIEAPVRITKQARRSKDWHIAVGPYLWASSVDADISLGSASVSTGVDFFDIKRHAKYGAEVLAEARYGRFAIYGDFMYGVVGVDGATEVGPLMVTLEGEASSLLVDGIAGVMLAGGEQSLLSLEARGGVRYQRTAISGSVNVAGTDVSPSAHVDAAADAIAGAYAAVRPCRRFALSGTLDIGVFGDSDRTWAAAADATFRITSRVRMSLGYRTLTTERTNVSIVMHGPRAAVQLVF